MRARIERRLRFSFTRYEPEVRRLEVIVADVDDHCPEKHRQQVQVRVRLSEPPDVVVMDLDRDLYIAADRAIARAARTVKHRRLTSEVTSGVHQVGRAG